MARKRKPKVGRPRNKNQAVVIRLVLSLDPVEHADLIQKFSEAPPRGLAALAISLMRNGIPKEEIAANTEQVIDSSLDDL
jgi:hypothetical protein